jgi:hypothetical protein
MLVAYMREDGFYLELPQLQQGLMWGLSRFAMVKPDLLKAKNVIIYLLPYLNSPDSIVRGLAAWALGLLHAGEAIASLEKLVNDPSPVKIFLNRTFAADTVGGLAHKALANIVQKNPFLQGFYSLTSRAAILTPIFPALSKVLQKLPCPVNGYPLASLFCLNSGPPVLPMKNFQSFREKFQPY